MNYENTIGVIGVGLILMAYFLHTGRYIENNGKLYYVLNIIGAAMACYASFLIDYLPFVILEATWTLVSIYGLMKAMKIKIT